MNNQTDTHVKFPVRYDSSGTYIWDAEDKMIADVRGWGWIQYLKVENPESVQDDIGQFIADAMNQKATPPKQDNEGVQTLKQIAYKLYCHGYLSGFSARESETTFDVEKFSKLPIKSALTAIEQSYISRVEHERLVAEAIVQELYSLITVVWGDKSWDEEDKYILNLKGKNILKRIKEIESTLSKQIEDRKE